MGSCSKKSCTVMSQWLLSRGSVFLVEADSGRGKSYMCAFFFFNLLLSFETIRGTLMVKKNYTFMIVLPTFVWLGIVYHFYNAEKREWKSCVFIDQLISPLKKTSSSIAFLYGWKLENNFSKSISNFSNQSSYEKSQS